MIPFRVATAFVLCTAVATGCATIKRVESLEQRALSLEVGLDSLTSSHQELVTDTSEKVEALRTTSGEHDTRMQSLAAQLDASEADLALLSDRVDSVESWITWSGKFSVTISPSDEPVVVFANQSGKSLRVRLRNAGKEPGGLSVKIRKIATLHDDLANPDVTAAWDLTPVGAQRWIRLGCGREITTIAEVGTKIDLLISPDERPVTCDEKSDG